MYLQFDKRIIELEQQDDWSEITDFVYHRWKNDPMNINQLLCAGVEFWCGIHAERSLKYNQDSETLNQFPNTRLLESRLCEVTKWGFDFFKGNSLFNLYFGYMIKVNPELFLDADENFDLWRIKGVEMIKEAYKSEPSNLVAKALFYQSSEEESYERYQEACRELWSNVSLEQWGESLFQRYLYGILDGDIWTSIITI